VYGDDHESRSRPGQIYSRDAIQKQLRMIAPKMTTSCT
jgi:hypothetical protein